MSGAVKAVVKPVAKVFGGGDGGGTTAAAAMPAPAAAAPVAAAPDAAVVRKDQLRSAGTAAGVAGFGAFEEDASVLGRTKKRSASRDLLG